MVDRETVALQVSAFDKRILIGKLNRKNAGQYLQWRKAILQQKAEEGKIIVEGYGSRREEYMNTRGKLLEQKYAAKRPKTGHHKRNSSIGGATLPPRNPSAEDLTKMEESSQQGQFVEEVTIIPEDKGSTEIYAFAGMHHIFVEHKKAVTMVRFANGDNDLLAFASMDGIITLVHALLNPGVIRQLKGHTGPVSEFVWSQDNAFLISCSLDKTVRLWDANTGECVRTIEHDSPCNCICFHPVANNVGCADGSIKVYNSAKLVFSVQVNSPVNAIEFNDRGDQFFVGDNKGFIHFYRAGPKARIMQPIGRVQASTEPVSSLEFKDWFSDQQNIQLLLANCKDNNVKLIRIEQTPKGMQLKLDKKFTLPCRKSTIRSCFCPSLSNKNRLSVASGSEEGMVYILDFKRKQYSINQLQGHGNVVHDVCWNDDETLLASCDGDGMVILWKRVKTVVTEAHDAARKKPAEEMRNEMKTSVDEKPIILSEPKSLEEGKGVVLEKPGTKLDPEMARYFGIPESEDVITYFSCALYRKFLIQGFMYITQNYLCFYAHLLGKKTKEVILLRDVATIEKKKQAMVMNSAIEVKMMDGNKHWFSNFIHRESAFDIMDGQVRKCKQANRPPK